MACFRIFFRLNYSFCSSEDDEDDELDESETVDVGFVSSLSILESTSDCLELACVYT
jgi:hypothetical protein